MVKPGPSRDLSMTVQNTRKKQINANLDSKDQSMPQNTHKEKTQYGQSWISEIHQCYTQKMTGANYNIEIQILEYYVNLLHYYAYCITRQGFKNSHFSANITDSSLKTPVSKNPTRQKKILKGYFSVENLKCLIHCSNVNLEIINLLIPSHLVLSANCLPHALFQ